MKDVDTCSRSGMPQREGKYDRQLVVPRQACRKGMFYSHCRWEQRRKSPLRPEEPGHAGRTLKDGQRPFPGKTARRAFQKEELVRPQ